MIANPPHLQDNQEFQKAYQERVAEEPARVVAIALLIKRHQEEFDALVKECQRKLGVKDDPNY